MDRLITERKWKQVLMLFIIYIFLKISIIKQIIERLTSF